MTPLNFAIVGLRLLGIYFLVESGPYFSVVALASAYLSQIQSKLVFSAWIPGTLQVILGLLLLIFSSKIARRIVPPAANETNGTGCALEDVQAIAFAATGILILVNVLPSIGRVWQSLSQGYASQTRVGIPQLLYLIGFFAQIAIGLILVLGSKGFRNGWRWIRTAGTGPSDHGTS